MNPNGFKPCLAAQSNASIPSGVKFGLPAAVGQWRDVSLWAPAARAVDLVLDGKKTAMQRAASGSCSKSGKQGRASAIA